MGLGCARVRVVAEGLFSLAFASPARGVGLVGGAVARLAAKQEEFDIISIMGAFAWVSRGIIACTAAGQWCCES